MREVDALTSATLKNLREHWWDDAFTAFVKETLQPKAGKRILDVGCGTGTAEVKLSRLRIAQVDFFGVDLQADRVKVAHAAAKSHNIGAHFSVADACALPFASDTFDSVFCVAVLQHIGDVPKAVAEFARVTRPTGRVVAVEPDNGARYWYSSLDSGLQVYEAGRQFFAGLAQARGDATDPTVGPRLPALFAERGIEPLRVQVFPVSRALVGAPPATLWEARRQAVREAIERAGDAGIRRIGQDYLKLLDRYAKEAEAAGSRFVEIQNTLLFATVGQKGE